MTPLMITLLVIAGIVILIAIGYMNHVVENNKLEKKRTEIELNDRLRRCGEITETFPGQLMTPALKLLLTRLELNVNQRLLHLNRTNAAVKARIAELNALAGIIGTELLQRAMNIDGLVISSLTQQPDDPLRLAKSIDADQMGAFGELSNRS